MIVSNQQLGLRITQRVGHFICDPPGVHTHHDPADCNHAPVGKDPLGVIAQSNRHTVTRTDALRLKPGREISDQLARLCEGPTLIAVDNVFLITIALPHHP